MIVLARDAARLPLQLDGRLLCAPGIWSPGSPLASDPLGAIVTPPLGWEWDGDPTGWIERPGALVWAPPRRPLERTLERLAREAPGRPRLITLAPDRPRAIAEALGGPDPEGAVGYLLWAASPEIVRAARRAAAALPIAAELAVGPREAVIERAAALSAAGADALWLGPPPIGTGGQRLWGPALLPVMLDALDALRHQPPQVEIPLVAGAGIGAVADAASLRAAGADAVALGPAWWARPALAREIAPTLE